MHVKIRPYHTLRIISCHSIVGLWNDIHLYHEKFKLLIWFPILEPTIHRNSTSARTKFFYFENETIQIQKFITVRSSRFYLSNPHPWDFKIDLIFRLEKIPKSIYSLVTAHSAISSWNEFGHFWWEEIHWHISFIFKTCSKDGILGSFDPNAQACMQDLVLYRVESNNFWS